MRKVFVTGGYDDLRSRQVRFLEEASRFGMLHILVWPDEVVAELEGKPPKFPLAERQGDQRAHPSLRGRGGGQGVRRWRDC